MRKNGVNRELIPIEGGVCAPEGFSANGVFCELPESIFPTENSEERENFAAIRSDKRCPVACVYSHGPLCGSPIAVTKKHIRLGYARAIVVTSGIANVNGAEGEKQAETLCRVFAKSADVLTEETVVASTGRIGRPFPLDSFLGSVKTLTGGLGKSHEKSLAAARAIMTEDKNAKQFAFSFELGAYRCKIGGICKGSARVRPDMATFLCFLTTDVNVSPEMLQKALSASTKNTFNLMDVDGVSSPNDTVCILANGRAGNFRIDCEDSEYKKFCYALEQVMLRVCAMIVADGDEGSKAFSCRVTGARSSGSAKSVARSVVSALALKKFLNELSPSGADGLLCAINESREAFDLSKISVSLRSATQEIVLFERGYAHTFLGENLKEVISAGIVEIRIDLGEGNYTARAYGRSCV